MNPSDLSARLVVYNIRHAPPAGFTAVSIGRAMPGRSGSVLGNPFRVGARVAQGEAAAASLPWLRAQDLAGGKERHELLRLTHRLLAGERLALGCWCALQVCHGNHVRTAVLGLAAQQRTQNAAEVAGCSSSLGPMR
ncbi:DUF4326 domain-containing protein [Deinococcus ruber]|uniref:DUF4326 domain-containing protein n=1 Tax=Deinococcus ruber TaxID=1848197 RepID=A0A918C8C3_9DEIO|nr:DUF4326 domain-containing protein [Deinococcus ruber]GGR10863.1 hypothetical protein GCM10008957_24520 [Deinococcus ruber]